MVAELSFSRQERDNSFCSVKQQITLTQQNMWWWPAARLGWWSPQSSSSPRQTWWFRRSRSQWHSSPLLTCWPTLPPKLLTSEWQRESLLVFNAKTVLFLFGVVLQLHHMYVVSPLCLSSLRSVVKNTNWTSSSSSSPPRGARRGIPPSFFTTNPSSTPFSYKLRNY